MTRAPFQVFAFTAILVAWLILDLATMLVMVQSDFDPYLARAISCFLAFFVAIIAVRKLLPHWHDEQIHKLTFLAIWLLGLIVNYAVFSILVLTFPNQPAALTIGVVTGIATAVLVTFFASVLCTESFAALLGLSRKQKLAVVLAPVVFGLYAIALGADANWDLYNYHLYAPFALLHDKLDIDFAVGGFQGYFNPTLDLTSYFLNTHLFPPISGFLQGWFQGLVFIAIFLIARNLLRSVPGSDGFRLPFLLAIFGSLTANFMSEVGTTMGDNTTAVFILFGLLILTTHWEALESLDRKAVAALGAAGMAMGFATGLKITAGISPIAACLALLFSHVRFRSKAVLIAFIFGVAVLYGFGLSGAPWMVRMWQEFGNPLFPQFGTLFPNSLAESMSVADTRWLPRNLGEYLLWPYVLSFDGARAGELPVRQIIWPIFFSAAILVAIRYLSSRDRPALSKLTDKEMFLISFVFIAFWAWTILFSIFRYAVAFEVLAPLCVLVLLGKLFPSLKAHRTAVWLLIASTVFTATNFHRNWGHEGWASPLYHTDLPAFEQPEETTVLLASGTEPLGWLATLFSPELAFINLSSSFPRGASFVERVSQVVEDRGGKIFVLTDGEPYDRARKVASYQRTAAKFGLTRSNWGCSFLDFAIGPLQMKAAVTNVHAGKERCEITVRPEDQIDVSLSNQSRKKSAAAITEKFGFVLIPSSCTPFDAGIGTGRKAYQVCAASMGRQNIESVGRQ